MALTFPLAMLALCAAAYGLMSEREGRSMAKVDAADASLLLPGEKGVLPTDFMAPVARLFGLSACDYTRSWYVEDRAYASLNVDNPSISCSVWPTRDRKQFAFASRIGQDAASIPVVGYVSREVMAGQMPRGVAVYITGGPGGDIAPGLNDALPAELVRRGYAILKLGYSGTRYGSAYPKPDFEIAARQVTVYLRSLGQRHVMVIGESLGAQIVERALTPDIASHVSGVALVHPLLFSPTQALRNFKNAIGVSDASDSIMTIRSTSAGDPPTKASKSANTLRRFAAFFPPEVQGKTLADYIAGNIEVPTLLAYGDADTRIGVELLPTLRTRCPKVQVLALPGVNHTITEQEARRIAEALVALGGDSAERGKHRPTQHASRLR